MKKIRVALPSRRGMFREILEGAIALDERIELVPATHGDSTADVALVEPTTLFDRVDELPQSCTIIAVQLGARGLALVTLGRVAHADSAAELGSAIRRHGAPLSALERVTAAWRLLRTGHCCRDASRRSGALSLS